MTEKPSTATTSSAATSGPRRGPGGPDGKRRDEREQRQQRQQVAGLVERRSGVIGHHGDGRQQTGHGEREDRDQLPARARHERHAATAAAAPVAATIASASGYAQAG